MSAIDFERTSAFVASVPPGRWTSYKDVATAGGNAHGAMAVGEWLRRNGEAIPRYWRVLRSDGYIAETFSSVAAGLPYDASSARELLRREGVRIDESGRADPRQRYTVQD